MEHERKTLKNSSNTLFDQKITEKQPGKSVTMMYDSSNFFRPLQFF